MPKEDYREGPAYATGSGEATEETPKKFVFNEEKHIMLEDAKKDYPKIKAGEEIEIPLVSKQDYGRIESSGKEFKLELK